MGVDLRTFSARNSDTACRVNMNLHRVNGLIRFNRRYRDKFVFAGKGIGRNQADGNRGSQDTNACLKEHIPAPKKKVKKIDSNVMMAVNILTADARSLETPAGLSKQPVRSTAKNR